MKFASDIARNGGDAGDFLNLDPLLCLTAITDRHQRNHFAFIDYAKLLRLAIRSWRARK